MKSRRHGRVRRWVIRPFLWGLAALAIVTAALVAYLESDGFARVASDYLLDWLESRLEREVLVKAIELDLLPLRLEARGLEVAGATEESPPFVTARRVVIDATVGSFLRPGIRLDGILVEEPRISVRWDESGMHDTPSWKRRARRARSDRAIELDIGLVEVLAGEVDLHDVRYPFDFTARKLSAQLTGGSEPTELSGRASATAFEMRLPRGAPYGGALVVDGSYKPGRLDIRQARMTGPDTDASFSGVWRWRDVRDLDLKIIAQSRLEVLDHLGLAPGLGTGPLRFAGTFRRVPGEWFVSGALASPGAVVFDRRLAAVEGRLFSEGETLRVEIDSSGYGGGELSGTVTVPFGDSRPVGVSLKLAGVELERLLEDQGIPIVGLAGGVTGVFDYQFERSDPRRGDGWADLEIQPLAASGALSERSWLPVSGSAPLSIGDGVIATDAIRVSGEHQLLMAGGSYNLASSSGYFDFQIVSERPSELVDLLPLDGEPMAWEPTSGRGTIAGRLELDPGDVRTSLRLDMRDLVAPGYSAESLRGGLLVTSAGVEDLRLELTRAGGAMLVAGSIPFTDEAPTGAPPFELSVDADVWPLEDVAVWLPWPPPAGGDFSGSLELVGSVESPSGRAEGRMSPVRTSLGEFPGLELALTFTPQTLAFERAGLELAEGRVDLTGDIGLPDGSLDLRVTSQRVVLDKLAILEELAPRLRGAVELEARLGGTLSEPRLEGRLLCQAVRVDGSSRVAAAETVVDLLWEEEQFTARGSVGDLVTLSGGGPLDWERADLDFEVETKSLGDLLALVLEGGGQPPAGMASGRLRASGTFGPGSRGEVELVASRVEVRQEGIALGNLEPVALAWTPEGVEVRSLYLGTEDARSEVFVRGSISPAPGSELALDVQASLAGEWLAPLLPGVDIEGGAFDVIGEIGGSVDAPRFNGVGEARGARLLVSGYPGVFEEVGAVVLLYPQRIVVENGSAEVARGRLQAVGSVDLTARDSPSYRFQVKGEGLEFRYPEGWTVRGDAELTLASIAEGRQVTGGLRLERAFYTRDVPLEIEQLLAALFERRRIEADDVEPWRSQTALSLEIETEEGLRIRNNLADLEGSAELVVRGSLARPVVFGEVELSPGGTLVYRGQEFTVERGALTFANPYRVEPVIDLVASTEMREYDVTLSLAGTLDRLQASFVSDPPLPELEVLALLTGGRDPREVTLDPTDSEVDSVAANSFLYGQATSLITGRFNRLFGLDQFRIDPLTSSTGDLSSARVTVGKRLSRDLFATYSYDPVQSDAQILELEWHISRSLVLVLTQNGDGTYAVDARWEKTL